MNKSNPSTELFGVKEYCRPKQGRFNQRENEAWKFFNSKRFYWHRFPLGNCWSKLWRWIWMYIGRLISMTQHIFLLFSGGISIIMFDYRSYFKVDRIFFSSEFSVGPLEGLKVGLVGLGPLNWVGQKVGFHIFILLIGLDGQKECSHIFILWAVFNWVEKEVFMVS